MSEPGGYISVDPCTTDIQSLAQFAVYDYNIKQRKNLVLRKTLKTETRLVDGTNYYLLLDVINDGHPKVYETIICVKEMVDGPFVEVDPCTADIQILAQFVVYEQRKNSMLWKVVKAEIKKVNWTFYRLPLELINGLRYAPWRLYR